MDVLVGLVCTASDGGRGGKGGHREREVHLREGGEVEDVVPTKRL